MCSVHPVHPVQNSLQLFLEFVPEFLSITLKRQLDRIYKIYRIIVREVRKIGGSPNGLTIGFLQLI